MQRAAASVSGALTDEGLMSEEYFEEAEAGASLIAVLAPEPRLVTEAQQGFTASGSSPGGATESAASGFPVAALFRFAALSELLSQRWGFFRLRTSRLVTSIRKAVRDVIARARARWNLFPAERLDEAKGT
jgi:hypothetical protein